MRKLQLLILTMTIQAISNVLSSWFSDIPVQEHALTELFLKITSLEEVQAVNINWQAAVKLISPDLYADNVDDSGRQAMLVACFQKVIFEASPLTGKEETQVLKKWDRIFSDTLTSLPKSPLRRFVEQTHRLISQQITRNELNAKTKHIYQRYAEICADKSRAWLAASRDTLIPIPADKRVVLLPECVVKMRKNDFAYIEALTEQIMHLSLSNAVVPLWQARRKNPKNSICTASPREHIVLYSQLSQQAREYVLQALDSDSELALHWILELQPLDHHSTNIGFVITPNKHLLSYSNCTFAMQASTLTFSDATNLFLAFSTNQIKATDKLIIRSSCNNIHSISFASVEEVLLTKHNMSKIYAKVRFFDNEYMLYSSNTLASFTSQSQLFHLVPFYFPIWTTEWAKKPLSPAQKEVLLDKEREDRILSFLVKPGHQMLYKTQIDALKLRWKNRSNHIAENEDASFISIARAMYPLLDSATQLVMACAPQNLHLIGSYTFPLESIIYKYLKLKNNPEHITVAASLQLVRKYMFKNEHEINIIDALKTIMSTMQGLGHTFDKQNHLDLLFLALETISSSHFVHTKKLIYDPDTLKELNSDSV